MVELAACSESNLLGPNKKASIYTFLTISTTLITYLSADAQLFISHYVVHINEQIRRRSYGISSHTYLMRSKREMGDGKNEERKYMSAHYLI